jgi:hypothetical protein
MSLPLLLTLAGLALPGAGPACGAPVVHLHGTPPQAPRRNRPHGIPWITTADARITAYPFYWHAPGYRGHTRLALAAHGTDGSANMKVLWGLREGGDTLAISGRGPAGRHFSRIAIDAGGGWYPSTVVVPSAGCWTLTLQSGDVRGTLRVLAL